VLHAIARAEWAVTRGGKAIPVTYLNNNKEILRKI